MRLLAGLAKATAVLTAIVLLPITVPVWVAVVAGFVCCFAGVPFVPGCCCATVLIVAPFAGEAGGFKRFVIFLLKAKAATPAASTPPAASVATTLRRPVFTPARRPERRARFVFPLKGRDLLVPTSVNDASISDSGLELCGDSNHQSLARATLMLLSRDG